MANGGGGHPVPMAGVSWMPAYVGMTQVSLSRLHHWLPGRKAYPEVIERTAEFHREITDAHLPQPDPVFHDAAALDTTVDMLDPQPTVVQGLVGPLLLQGEILAAGFLGRHADLHLGQRTRQEVQILQEPVPRRQRRRRRVGNGRIMSAAAIGVTEKEEEEQRIDEQDMFDRVVAFLAALTRFLFNRVLGADDTLRGAVMGTRGDTSGAATGRSATGGGSSASGVTTGAASATEMASRRARTTSKRAGASPRVRRAASSTGRSTCIH